MNNDAILPGLFREMFHNRTMNTAKKMLHCNLTTQASNCSGLRSRSICVAIKPYVGIEPGYLLVTRRWYTEKFNQVLCTQAACAGTGISSLESSKGPLQLQAHPQL